MKQFIPGQIKCLSASAHRFFNETSETELIAGLSRKQSPHDASGKSRSFPQLLWFKFFSRLSSVQVCSTLHMPGFLWQPSLENISIYVLCSLSRSSERNPLQKYTTYL